MSTSRPCCELYICMHVWGQKGHVSYTCGQYSCVLDSQESLMQEYIVQYVRTQLIWCSTFNIVLIKTLRNSEILSLKKKNKNTLLSSKLLLVNSSLTLTCTSAKGMQIFQCELSKFGGWTKLGLEQWAISVDAHVSVAISGTNTFMMSFWQLH